MNRDPENAVTIISADGVGRGHLEGNDIHVLELRKQCQCEHASHFWETRHVKTPHGNFGHQYGQHFHTHQLVEVETCNGKFLMCKDCASDCFAPDSPYRKTNDQ